LLEKEFVEEGTIRVPMEPIDPRESDVEKEKETLVEKSGMLDNTNVVIGPNVKYLKSVDPSHVKEFVSACQSLRPDGWGRTKNYTEFSLKLLSVAEVNFKAHTRLKPYSYQLVALFDQENKNGAKKEKRKHDHSDATEREQKKSRQDSLNQSAADCNHCGWNNHKAANRDCHRKNDPDLNPKADVAWKDSDAGSAWNKLGNQDSIQWPDALEVSFNRNIPRIMIRCNPRKEREEC